MISRQPGALAALVVLVACGAPVVDGDPVPGIEGAVHRFWPSGQGRWHALEAGQGDAVVLLHGLPETAWGWRHQLAGLAAHYRVVALDLKGFGLTAKPEGDYSFAAIALEVEEVLRAADISRFHLVGHDWGAIIAAHLAARDPDAVLSYTHVSAPLDRLDLSGWADFRDFHDDPASAAGFLRSADVFVNRIFQRMLHGGLEAIPEEHLQRHIDEFGRRGVRQAVGWYFRDLDLDDDWMLRGASRPVWAQVTAPVQIIVGDRDYRVPLELFLDAEAQIPSFVRMAVVDESGHYPAEEKPARFNALLLEHLEKQ